MKLRNYGSWLCAVIIGLLVAVGSARGQAKKAAFNGDIACAERKKFMVPMACAQECTRRTLANFGSSSCGFSPSCPAYGKDKNPNLKSYYDQAIFPRVSTGKIGQIALVSHIIDTIYPPNNVKQIKVQIGESQGGDDWASIEPGSGQMLILTVKPDLLLLTPGYLISTIGHEMVHVEQGKRKYKTDLTGISDLKHAMQEREASSWELGADNFSHSIGADQAGSCIQSSEKSDTQIAYECQQWEINHAIEGIRTSRSHYLTAAENWLKEDPWASQVWLPKNPNWRSVKAGDKPEKCKPNKAK